MTSHESKVAGVFMLIALGLSIWYLIAYAFQFDKNNCDDIIENGGGEAKKDCERDATFLAALGIFVLVIILLMIGMVSVPKIRRGKYKYGKRGRRGRR